MHLRRSEPHPGENRWHRGLRRAGIGLAGTVATLTVASLVVNVLTADRAETPSGLTFVQAADVPTRIRTWGTSGSPIVLLHGAAETADTWEPVAERLAARHLVYALDLVGWGYSRRIGPFSLDHQTRQLFGLLDALDLDRPVLVGHSSGAAPAAEAVLRAPGRIGGLLLLDGDALDTGAGQRSLLRFAVVPPYRTTLLRLALASDGLIRGIYGRQCGPRCPELDADGVDAWRRPLQVGGAEDGLWGMLQAGSPGVSASRLAGVAATGVPTSVLFGAQDDVFPPRTPQQTAQRIGAPPPVIIPGGRHLTMISDPGPVADAVEALCDRAGPPDH
jgi:pimeloyl-ACP methyl ester carboxylesterase